jgi:nitrogen-specific signal transduction histidine kinase
LLCDPGLPHILADAERLCQVFKNLGEYAIRFTRRAGA